ncbi:DUF6600 domain-containing protein [Legionella longbeachae]|uniref:Putative proline-rich exported protein n=1 Tax=Legionella longbeachae serogroup 1 (strain NSW150) TaxID=661367 RepID=D3HJR6_LEGLN|nr:DUF6600 domain-containing protein [Legionella longbeachae]CBJ12663.1 putative proline-rich exported protein [Legionella longbeachae NSW150]VEE03194.1 Uncharacterised protein [Legionella oakridgensis]
MEKVSIKNTTMLTVILGCFICLISSFTFADPPSQVARLSYINGTVSFLPAGETQWVNATLNRPLIINDQIWSDSDSRVEMQLPGADIRIGNNSDLKILNLDYDIAQFQMTQGTLVLIIKRVNSDVYEVDTPNLAFTISEPGYYRFDVSAENNTTTVSIRVGEGTVYGESTSYVISAGQSCRATGTDLDNYQCKESNILDDFDAWCLDRDKNLNEHSTQYVSSDTIGYEDLGSYGSWVEDDQYGQVWLPNNVDPDWAPYQYGQWIWLSEWGWTWVDNQPWGFAPFHYGRWAYIKNHWGWIPGPVDARPIYAPTLTVFIGGDNSQLLINGGGYGIAWFPLAPGEVYIPPYHVSEQYFTAINISNTEVNVTYINNIYNHKNMTINYKNVRIANAVTVVPIADFTNSMIVHNKSALVSRQVLLSTPKTYTASVAPKPVSVFGSKKVTEAIPPEKIISKLVVMKTKPSAPTPSFKEGQELLLKNGSKPWIPLQIHKLDTKKNFNDIFQKVEPKNTKKFNDVFQKVEPKNTKNFNDIFQKVEPKNKKNINEIFQKVEPNNPIQQTPPVIKQAPPVVVHPLPGAAPQVPSASPKPKVTPGTNTQPGVIQTAPVVQPGSNPYHHQQANPKPNVQPKVIQTAPVVQPGSNPYHHQQGNPKPNVQPGAIQTPPVVQPGSNPYHHQQGNPKPNVQPKVIQTAPVVQPGSNLYHHQQGNPKPNVQPKVIQTAPVVQPGSNPYHHQQGNPKPNVQPGLIQTAPVVQPGSNPYHQQQGIPKPNP